MKLIRKLFDFYINSSIHVALSVFSLTWITLIELELPYNKAVLYVVFYATITGYNFVKYFAIARFHHRQLASGLKAIQILSFFSFLFMCFYAYRLELRTLMFLSGFALLTVLYAVPFTSKNSYTLRTVSGLKVFVIALVWAGVSVFFPVINENYTINTDVLLMAIQRFLFVLVLILPFEIRDLKYDSLKLATIPQKIGVKRTKFIGVLLLVVFLMLEFFKDETNSNQIIALIIITLVTLLFLVFSKKEQGKYYCAFWVEGLPILWLGILLFLY